MHPMLGGYFIFGLLSAAATGTAPPANDAQKDWRAFLKSPDEYTEVSIEVRHVDDGRTGMSDHSDLGDHLSTILCGLLGGSLLLLLFIMVIRGCAMIHERERQPYISVP
uniref:Uncharacterized protein n=1 Tax=Trichuris muris TaxID=70415 RepID=A0A5S6QC06_TRIMR